MLNRFFLIVIACFLLSVYLSSCAELNNIFPSSAKTARTAPAAKTSTTQPKPIVVKPVKQTDQTDRTDQTKFLDQKTGQRKPIVTKKGTYYFVAPDDTLANIAKKYRISEEDLAQINDLYDSQLVVGRRLFIPKKSEINNYLTVTNWIRMRRLEQDQSNAVVTFIWPVKEFTMTSKFGWRKRRPHDGLDLSAPRGTPFYAVADGKVIYSKKFAGYGNMLVIQHPRSYFTAYAHAHMLSVKEGDSVKQGEKIGVVGTTGRTTGPHLHFEVHKGAQALDPMTVLPKGQVTGDR